MSFPIDPDGLVRYLESMDLDGRLLQAILDEECRDLRALVSLKLDDLAHLFIINESSIAGEFLHKNINFEKEFVVM